MSSAEGAKHGQGMGVRRRGLPRAAVGADGAGRRGRRLLQGQDASSSWSATDPAAATTSTPACSRATSASTSRAIPTIVVQNMPGAGSLRAANYLYSVAPKDGTVFGTFARNMPLLGLLKTNQNVQFDPRKFTWLGSSSSFANDAYLLLVRKDATVKTVEDARRPGGPPHHPRRDGRRHVERRHADGPARHARLQHQADQRLHRQRRAVHGDGAQRGGGPHGRLVGREVEQARLAEAGRRRCRRSSSFGRATRHPDFPNVPTARELAKSDRDRDPHRNPGSALSACRDPTRRRRTCRRRAPRRCRMPSWPPTRIRPIWRRRRSSTSTSARSSGDEILQLIERIAQDAAGRAQVRREADRRLISAAG